MRFLKKAQAAKAIPEHEVIDEAIQYQGDQFTVFSIVSFIPRKTCYYLHTGFRRQRAGVIYRPAEIKLRNAPTRNYLGRAVGAFRIIPSSQEFKSSFS